jgi:hypothetical protein
MMDGWMDGWMDGEKRGAFMVNKNPHRALVFNTNTPGLLVLKKRVGWKVG